MDPNYVKIFDTTLRDGEQAPGNSMNLDKKLRMATQLEQLKVDVIEAGFPIASPDDFAAVREVAKLCKHAEVCGLARALEKDIKCAWDALKHAEKPRIHTFIATSEIHMQNKLQKKPEQVFAMAVEAVRFAKSLCDRVDFSPEDATRSDPKFLYSIIEAVIHAGADTINIPDTVGYSTPEEFGALIKGIKENVPNIDQAIISTHCHNDLGMAVGNSLAGVQNGARQIECTVNGIGERAGNASLEEVVMALNVRGDAYGVEHGVVSTELYPSSRLLTSLTGVAVQPNKAIVGANAFAHEAGIHQDGMLKDSRTYEIMKPEHVGRDRSSIVLGKHSGRAALKDRLAALGYDVGSEELNRVYDRFVDLADKKKEIFDTDLVLLLAEQEERVRYLNVSTTTKGIPNAQVTLVDENGNERTATAEGDGPVSAAYRAINKVIDMPNTLMQYSVNSLTHGADSMGYVSVQVKVDDRMFSGTSSDTDIIVASVKAYLDALNRARQLKEIIAQEGL